MCTVTFMPVNGKVFITSSRDEKSVRNKALPPQVNQRGAVSLLYPKDAAAGGTWIAMHQNGHAAVLLNGAFVKHVAQPPYRKSRGLVFLDIISSESPLQHFRHSILNQIEPFTVIIWENGCLHECRWDGVNQHYKTLHPLQPHIWSSATLYPPEIATKRAKWFHQWLQKTTIPTQIDLFNFHRFAGDGDAQNDILMNRNGQMLTVSITGMALTPTDGQMHYLDVATGNQFHQNLAFTPVLAF